MTEPIVFVTTLQVEEARSSPSAPAAASGAIVLRETISADGHLPRLEAAGMRAPTALPFALSLVALALAGCLAQPAPLTPEEAVEPLAEVPGVPELPGVVAVFEGLARSGPAARVEALAWLPEGADTVVLAVHGCCGMNKDNNWQPMAAAPGYSLGHAVAETGRAFVGIDLPGTGTSPGLGLTAGAIDDEALLVHQLAAALRAGDYAVEARDAPAFSKVVALGHSRGSIVIEVAQGTYGGFDALVPTGWATGPMSEEAQRCFDQGDCPEDLEEGEILSPSMMFFLENADPAVVEELMGGIGRVGTTPLDVGGFLLGPAQERIRVPVLNVEGAEDWVWEREVLEAEPERFPNAPRSDLLMLGRTGHMVFHHLGHLEAAAGLDGWLDEVGL